MIRLSVIVPVYNVAPYLRACLDSAAIAIRQAEVPAEIICIDDGSTDDSGLILDEYSKIKDVKCVSYKILHQDNAGVSLARNAGLDIATGEWVMMLDGDDRWAPDLVAKLFEIVKKVPDCDAVGFSAQRIDEHGNVISGRSCGINYCETTGDEILLDGKGAMSHFIWSSCDKIYRRSVIEKSHLRYIAGMQLGEDCLFSQMFFGLCGKVVLAPDVGGYLYLMREGSAIHTLYSELPSSPFLGFFVLHELWRKNRKGGLLRRLQLIAAGTPTLCKESVYTKEARQKAIEFLLESKEFKRIVYFMMSHGTWKSRIFAIGYLISPRCIKRRVLQCL